MTTTLHENVEAAEPVYIGAPSNVIESSRQLDLNSWDKLCTINELAHGMEDNNG